MTSKLIMQIKWIVQWILVERIILSLQYDHKPWDYDVYTGSHFNSLVLPTNSLDEIVKTPAVLIMFAPECMDHALSLKGTIKPWGPKDQYQVVAMYDYVTYPNHIWYKLDEIDDLYQRYMNEKDPCLKILYFKIGTRLSKPIIYNPDIDFYDWIWDKMVINIKIANALRVPIKVKIEGQGDPRLLVDIKAWEVREIAAHVSMFITIYDERDTTLLYYYKLEYYSNWKTIQITDDFLSQFKASHQMEPGWLIADRNQMDLDSNKVHHFHWVLAESILLTLKQPVIAKRFTDTGYKVMKIPEEVYNTIKSFYDNNKDSRIEEVTSTGQVNPHLNEDEVPTTMVHLSEEVRLTVYDALLQLMEEWCLSELEGTSFYGIREYYKGSILRNHVDRVSTHVISSILQIHQDLNGNPDWDLEVIGFDGVRKQIQLKSGEMLLYESATLIHGRPKPFQGNIFANCFLHYKPKRDWSWDRTFVDGKQVLTDGNVIERIDVINTDLTLAPDGNNIDYAYSKTEL